MSTPDIVTSTGIVGTYFDDYNSRYRGMLGTFMPGAEPIIAEWQRFQQAGAKLPQAAGRLTLRAVTTPAAAEAVTAEVSIESYFPLSEEVGVLYLGLNAPDRQPQLPIEAMNQTVQTAAEAIRDRMRSPVDRIRELAAQGYSFNSIDPDTEGLHRLWGRSFGWSPEAITALDRRLYENCYRKPEDRDLWLTTVSYRGETIGAVMSERLDVPGPNGDIPMVESTEWFVDWLPDQPGEPRRRHPGVASAMVAMNIAQCLQDLPDARIFAECRYSTSAYAAGMSVGMRVPDRDFCPQILPRNVWVEGELADFVPLVLPDVAAAIHYSTNNRQAMLAYLD